MSDSSKICASLEIRVPRAHVQGLASQLDSVMAWLWSPEQLSAATHTRELPDGGRQLLVRDGDKLRTRVVSSEQERVVVEAAYVPRDPAVPSRRLHYELALEGGPGTTRVELSLSWQEGEAPSGVAGERRWRRNLEQCLSRLQQAATAAHPGAESTG